ncbi:uncharacterized protein LOC142355855 [Convolutriloba macropyga]|uniref:uncharacterized protein LOC142355855 n=1 Tax=Convolutriloba macropyga TaxID=536237 RepID=UPI003F51FBA7
MQTLSLPGSYNGGGVRNSASLSKRRVISAVRATRHQKVAVPTRSAGLHSGLQLLLGRRHRCTAGRRDFSSEDIDDEDDYDDELDDQDDIDVWEQEVEAQQVDLDETEVPQVQFHEDLGDEDMLSYTAPDEIKLKPPQFDPDPRMRILTKDGSRWDENGVDRLKFRWEKQWYEVQEFNQTPEMLELCREVDLEVEAKLQRKVVRDEQLDVIRGGSNVLTDLMTDDAWKILMQYVPTEEEEEREDKRVARLARLQEEDLPIEEKRELMAEQNLYEKEEWRKTFDPEHFDRNRDEETGEWHLTNNAMVKKWREYRQYLKDDPEYAERMQVAGDDFVDQVNRLSKPITPTYINQEENLTEWEMRAFYEAKKQKEQKTAAYWKDFEERVGSAREYNCTPENDVRLIPTTGRKPKQWTDEEIWNLITNNGVNASPEDVYRESLTIIDPKMPCDHVGGLWPHVHSKHGGIHRGNGTVHAN